MIENAQMEAESGLGTLTDAYLAWVCSESECERALRAWFGGDGPAYVLYRAALEQEEEAARELQRLSETAQPAFGHRVPGRQEVSR